jgi:excinuclease ABC subunit C
LYLVRHGRIVAEARCTDPASVAALQALEHAGVQVPTGAAVDHLDELLMVEQWFRGRPNDPLKADSVPAALAALAHQLQTRLVA